MLFNGLRELYFVLGFNDEYLFVELIYDSDDEEFSDVGFWIEGELDEEDLMEEIGNMILFELYIKILKEKERKYNFDLDEESR